MTKRILIVGLNPSPENDDPTIPFDGSPSGKILRDWVGYIMPNNSSVVYMNLVPDKITANSNQITKSDMVDNMVRTCDYIAEVNPTHIIALGTRTYDFIKRYINPDVLKLPHPSPRNRQLNDKIFVDEKLNIIKKELA